MGIVAVSQMRMKVSVSMLSSSIFFVTFDTLTMKYYTMQFVSFLYANVFWGRWDYGGISTEHMKCSAVVIYPRNKCAKSLGKHKWTAVVEQLIDLIGWDPWLSVWFSSIVLHYTIAPRVYCVVKEISCLIELWSHTYRLCWVTQFCPQRWLSSWLCCQLGLLCIPFIINQRRCLNLSTSVLADELGMESFSSNVTLNSGVGQLMGLGTATRLSYVGDCWTVFWINSVWTISPVTTR